jgi:hypothetical protein
MGWLSKTFKKIVKSIKKVGKAIAKPFKKVLGAVGKLTTKVFGKWAPLAMMAVGFFTGGVGSLLTSAWQGFGSIAAGAAASTNAIISTLGNIGSTIFNAGNAVGGFVSSISDGISKGFTQVSEGNFSNAADAIGDGFSKAFSGEASSEAMSRASFQAFQDSTGNAGAALQNTSSAQAGAEAFQAKDAINLDVVQPAEAGSLLGGQPIGDLSTVDFSTPLPETLVPNVELDAVEQLYGEQTGGSTLGDSAKKALKRAFEPEPFEFEQPDFERFQGADTDAQGQLDRSGGLTSSGGSLLSGVQGLAESIEASRKQFAGGF